MTKKPIEERERKRRTLHKSKDMRRLPNATSIKCQADNNTAACRMHAFGVMLWPVPQLLFSDQIACTIYILEGNSLLIVFAYRRQMYRDPVNWRLLNSYYYEKNEYRIAQPHHISIKSNSITIKLSQIIHFRIIGGSICQRNFSTESSRRRLAIGNMSD